MTKIQLFIAITLATSLNLAAELPKHAFMKELKLSPIGGSKEVVVVAKVALPVGHKLNKQAPSAIDVYEKGPSGWQKLTSIDLRGAFAFDGLITVTEKVALSDARSSIALDSTIYHCDQNGKYCAIESFQGISKRAIGKSNSLTVAIKGSQP